MSTKLIRDCEYCSTETTYEVSKAMTVARIAMRTALILVRRQLSGVKNDDSYKDGESEGPHPCDFDTFETWGGG